MGAGNSILTNQILYYYLFHKKLEVFFKGQYNPFFQIYKEEIKLDKYYIINKEIITIWKDYCSYDLHKKSLDKINIYSINIEDYIEKLQRKINSLNEKLGKQYISEKYYNDISKESNWYSQSKLQYENFDNIIDENTYQFFKSIFSKELVSNILGIITGEKLIIFYENFCQIKFLHSGQSINQGINNISLIQLTADFSQISNGIYDKFSTRDAYNGFKKLIQKNINFAFKLLDNQNINYSKEETINFSSDIGNGYAIHYSFILRNDNLIQENIGQNYTRVNYAINKSQTNVLQNNNNFNNKANNNFQNISQINSFQQVNNNINNNFQDIIQINNFEQMNNNNFQNNKFNHNYQQLNNNMSNNNTFQQINNNNYNTEINELKRQLAEEKNKNKKLLYIFFIFSNNQRK